MDRVFESWTRGDPRGMIDGDVTLKFAPPLMGASTSSELRPDEIVDLTEQTSLTPKEVRRMYARFRKLDRGRKGYVTQEDLMTIPELVMTPLAPRIVSLFLEDCEEGMNFKHFVTVLSTFLDRTGRFLKEKFLFSLFDANQDGFVSGEDLRVIIQGMVGESIRPEQVDVLVSQTLAALGPDADGNVSQENFVKGLAATSFAEDLSLPFTRDGAIGVLGRLMGSPHGHVKFRAIGAIPGLCRDASYIANAFFAAGVGSHLLSSLNDTSTSWKSRARAARAIEAIATECPESRSVFIEGGALPSLAALLNYSPERPLRGIAKDTFAALGQRWYLFEIDEDDEDMNQESIVSSLSTASGPHLPVTEVDRLLGTSLFSLPGRVGQSSLLSTSMASPSVVFAAGGGGAGGSVILPPGHTSTLLASRTIGFSTFDEEDVDDDPSLFSDRGEQGVAAGAGSSVDVGEGTSADVGRLSAAKSKWYQKGKQEERAAIASVVKDEADDGFFAGEDDY